MLPRRQLVCGRRRRVREENGLRTMSTLFRYCQDAVGLH